MSKIAIMTMPANSNGYPIRCLSCDGDKGRYLYVCGKCFGQWSTSALIKLYDAWDAAHRKRDA